MNNCVDAEGPSFYVFQSFGISENESNRICVFVSNVNVFSRSRRCNWRIEAVIEALSLLLSTGRDGHVIQISMLWYVECITLMLNPRHHEGKSLRWVG